MVTSDHAPFLIHQFENQTMPNPTFAILTDAGSAGATDNPTPGANIYPAGGGSTLSTAAGAGSLVSTENAGGGASIGTSGQMAAGGVVAQPLTWWVTMIILFIVLGFVAKKAGNAGEFGNLKVSAYNILMITIAAIIGIAGLKVLFTKFPVPGITTLLGAV